MSQTSMIERLESVLVTRFPGSTIDLEPGSEYDRITGWVIWDGFEPFDQIDRQRLLREVLDGFSKEDRLQIGAILTMTPFEASDDDEEDAA